MLEPTDKPAVFAVALTSYRYKLTASVVID